MAANILGGYLIRGVTTFTGAESFGSDGRRHSAKFFELTDQPIEIMMAVTEEQSDALFGRINAVKTRLFYIKVPVEYGELGSGGGRCGFGFDRALDLRTRAGIVVSAGCPSTCVALFSTVC